MQCNLKFYPRLSLWKNSTGTMKFTPQDIRATSYDWWVFVRKVGNTVYFNDYRYSVTTSAHQRAMRRLLQELGIAYTTVSVSHGLQAPHVTTEFLSALSHR